MAATGMRFLVAALLGMTICGCRIKLVLSAMQPEPASEMAPRRKMNT